MSASFDLFGGTFHNTEALVRPTNPPEGAACDPPRSLGHHSELPVVGSMRSLLFLVVTNIAMAVAQWAVEQHGVAAG